jgi:N-acetylmuramoyl-L-alanine amidase
MEYQLTLDVSLKLKAELERRGYTVYLTRSTNDVNITNAERAQYANSCGACAYIRLHADGAQSSSASGASAFYPSRSNPFVAGLSDASASLSTCVMNGYLAATGMRSRGVGPRDDLSGSNWSQIPVTLLEMGFMTNPSDDVNMANEAFQEKMVRGIADGLDAYFAS